MSSSLISTVSFAQNEQQLPPLSPENGGRSIIPSALQVGDIIVSTTRQFASRIIRNQTDLPISHARIVYNVQNNKNPEFFEAVHTGVRVVTYDDMMKGDTLSVALRKTTLSAQKVKELREWLIGKIGSDYDYGGVFEEWLALKIKWLDKIRSVALGDSKKFYCSELVAEAYKAIGMNLLKYENGMPNRNSAPGRFVELSWFDELSYVGHLKY